MNQHDLLTIVLLSIKMGLLATLVNLPIALGVSFVMTRKQFPGKNLIDGIINLPLVMPPVTTGYLLLFILGKKGIIGAVLFSAFGIRIAFTSLAVVIASMVVSFPLISRSIRISLEMVDHRLEDAAKTLGASKREVFIRIILPQVMPGLITGTVLGFARSMGEFGATMTFAGNIQGVTRTIPLAVYSKLQIPGMEKDAAILVGISVVISFIALYLSNIFSKPEKHNRKRIRYGT